MAIKLDDGTYGPGLELLDWTTYFTFKMDSVEREHICFKNIVGDTYQGRTLTEWDTNVIQKNIPHGQKYVVWGIRIKYMATDIRNDEERQFINNFLRTTTAKFYIAGKDNVGYWTMSEWFGPMQMVAVPTNAGDNVPFSSMGNYEGIKNLNIPIILEEDTTFDMTFTKIIPSDASLNEDYVKIELIHELDRRG